MLQATSYKLHTTLSRTRRKEQTTGSTPRLRVCRDVRGMGDSVRKRHSKEIRCLACKPLHAKERSLRACHALSPSPSATLAFGHVEPLDLNNSTHHRPSAATLYSARLLYRVEWTRLWTRVWCGLRAWPRQLPIGRIGKAEADPVSSINKMTKPTHHSLPNTHGPRPMNIPRSSQTRRKEQTA